MLLRASLCSIDESFWKLRSAPAGEVPSRTKGGVRRVKTEQMKSQHCFLRRKTTAVDDADDICVRPALQIVVYHFEVILNPRATEESMDGSPDHLVLLVLWSESQSHRGVSELSTSERWSCYLGGQ